MNIQNGHRLIKFQEIQGPIYIVVLYRSHLALEWSLGGSNLTMNFYVFNSYIFKTTKLTISQPVGNNS